MRTLTPEKILESLNSNQQLAVSHGFDPLLIVAGAGTGKTTTLAHRVAYLIATGVDPGRILLLTFTRRSSSEMLQRVSSILNQSLSQTEGLLAKRIWGGTFHAVAVSLLRKYGKAIGLPPTFTILDRSDAEDLMQSLREELNLNSSERKFPSKSLCVSIYSRCMNTRETLKAVLSSRYPSAAPVQEELSKLFDLYVDRKDEQGVLDYDDLLLFWRALFDDPNTAYALENRFDCVLVDEFQDTNLLQAEILKAMRPETGEGITVVGDDAQSIYAFRGATVRNILDFQQDFPRTKVITLEENYRSTQPILQVTNQIIKEAVESLPKELWSSVESDKLPVLLKCADEYEETDFITTTILEGWEAGLPLREQAVLFRSSHQSLMLEAELTRRHIPFHKYGGLKFLETAHVKDLLAFLKLAENPRDGISGLRALMLLPGIGKKRATSMLDQLAFHTLNANPFECWKEIKPPKSCEDLWPKFTSLMIELATPEPKEVPIQFHLALEFYSPLLKKKYPDHQLRFQDLEQLELVGHRYADRTAFLAEITLDPPNSTIDLPNNSHPDDEKDFLVLSTIHSAKGLEWDTIFVLQACDGSIPSVRSMRSTTELEEERRLFYVALSRAKNNLYVTHPARVHSQRNSQSSNFGMSPLTQFLSKETLKMMEQTWHEPQESHQVEESHSFSSITTASVRKKQKNQW